MSKEVGTHYPPLGFYFKVFFHEEPGETFFNLKEPAWGFQSVSGLTSELVTEDYKEGGQRYDYALPLKIQYPDLVLKRGLYLPTEAEKPGSNALQELLYYFQNTMNSRNVKPINIKIQLLNPNKKDTPLMSWEVRRCWPKKWSVSDFNAEENQIVIETLEFHYDYFKIIK